MTLKRRNPENRSITGIGFPAKSFVIPWLYYRFCLSFRDVEDLIAERGINVSYETVRRWCIRFGPACANRLRERSGPGGDQWFVDEVFVRIEGKLRYLYRPADQDGQVLDILVQTRRNTSRLGSESIGCDVSNLSAMLSDFYRFTGLCRICLPFLVI